jgi:hypothetical protein
MNTDPTMDRALAQIRANAAAERAMSFRIATDSRVTFLTAELARNAQPITEHGWDGLDQLIAIQDSSKRARCHRAAHLLNARKAHLRGNRAGARKLLGYAARAREVEVARRDIEHAELMAAQPVRRIA